VIVYFYSLFIHFIQTHGPYNKGNQIMHVHINDKSSEHFYGHDKAVTIMLISFT